MYCLISERTQRIASFATLTYYKQTSLFPFVNFTTLTVQLSSGNEFSFVCLVFNLRIYVWHARTNG